MCQVFFRHARSVFTINAAMRLASHAHEASRSSSPLRSYDNARAPKAGVYWGFVRIAIHHQPTTQSHPQRKPYARSEPGFAHDFHSHRRLFLSTVRASRASVVQARNDRDWEEKFRAITQAERIKKGWLVDIYDRSQLHCAPCAIEDSSLCRLASACSHPRLAADDFIKSHRCLPPVQPDRVDRLKFHPITPAATPAD